MSEYRETPDHDPPEKPRPTYDELVARVEQLERQLAECNAAWLDARFPMEDS